MSEPESFTAAQAADPATPGQTLADIAALRPDLRPAVAGNPAAYPGLLEWLASLGEPAVDAALAARSAAEQQTAVLPVQPVQPVAPQAPAAPEWQGQAPTAPYAQPAAPFAEQAAPFGAPAQAPYGQPAQAPYGQAPAVQAPYGQAPYGAPAGAPPKKSAGGKVALIIGIVLGVLLLIGVGLFFAARAFLNNVAEDIPGIGDGQSYGDDAALDALWDACEAEDWEACDELFREAPLGSEYEAFGNTCGNRTSGGTFCVDEFGAGTATDPGTTDGEASAYGDDPALDALWDACAGGDLQACDDLYFQAPIGSEYETFGSTCGGTTDGTAACVTGDDTASTGGFTYGDNPALDALWDACAAGDNQACDDLYDQSDIDSEYEAFGDTCGGRQAEGTGVYCTENG